MGCYAPNIYINESFIRLYKNDSVLWPYYGIDINCVVTAKRCPVYHSLHANYWIISILLFLRPVSRGFKTRILCCITVYVCLEMFILSVDIGVRNFGMSVYCTEKKEFILFKLLNLGKVKDYVLKMKELTSEEPFLSAGVILVENQMRSCMKTMATAIRAFHFDKVVCVAPQSIKHFFRSSMKKHSKNKKVAVELARTLLNKMNLSKYENYKKKDDIADCILQTHWYIQKYQQTRCSERVVKVQ